MWKWLVFLTFCAVVAAEASVVVTVGRWIGVGWTVLWMVGSALFGLAVMRVGGIQAVIRIHHRLRDQELPTLELLDMALVLFAGALLIAPGFLTDAMGLLLLIPPVRWVGRVCFCALYGELLPPSEAPRQGPMGEEVIEIRPEK